MSLMVCDAGAGRLLDDTSGLRHVRFEGGTEAPLHPASHRFIAYCQARCGADGVLPRAALAPREMPRLLPNLFMADRSPSGWRYRLFGTALVERLGVEVTCRGLDEIFEAKTAARVAGLYDSVIADGRPISRRGRFFGLGRSFFLTELTQFAMLARDGHTRMIFGGLFFFDHAATAR